MWVELLCGFVIYRLFRRFFYDDDTFDLETSGTDAKFLVANRLEKLYGGKVYLGLRIPDADSGSRQNIDMVLVTKGEAMVIGVSNISGLDRIDPDGSWIYTDEKKHKTKKLPDPVLEIKKQVAVLESYLEQRGVAVPDGFISGKVVLPNPKSRNIYSINFPSEVITFDDWMKLKPDTKTMVSGWFKDAFRGGKKGMQEGTDQQLHSILATAPIWDRLELHETKNLLGEFLEFKGKSEDVLALRNIKRSKVSRITIQKSSMLGITRSNLQVLYCARDYRNEGASASNWNEVTVRASTEVLFQPQDSKKVCKFKLSSITSMSLSA